MRQYPRRPETTKRRRKIVQSRFCLVQTALLLGSLLTLHSTVDSAEDGAPVTPPNVHPNLDVELGIENERAKQNRRVSESKRFKPAALPIESTTAPPHAKPSEFLEALPVASTSNTKSTGLYPISAAEKRLHREFMDWCKQVLGIQTILEIQTFEYYDYIKTLPLEDWDDNNDDDAIIDEELRPPPVESFATIPVRGLAASRDIQEGEVIIRVPVQALFSVATTIDNDPVLSRVMGPEARRKYGWDETVLEDDDDDTASSEAVADRLVLEIPLLAVALLHHKKLGASSPLSPYFRILERTPVDNFPFLWSNAKLKSQTSEGIRTVARGIKREIKDMYATVVQVLINEHPDIFGNRTSNNNKSDDSSDAADGTVDADTAAVEWVFSLEHFQWAFAIVNSRHWQLSIPDLATTSAVTLPKPAPAPDSPSGDDQMLPPADTPTDHWIHQDQPLLSTDRRRNNNSKNGTMHSFLAPVADLLNFGPPCTRGRYDEASKAFEIIASCNFTKHQEVTFWYTNECDHVFVGVYGFTHPLVPKCPSAQEYRRSSEEWQRQAKALDEELERKNELLKTMDGEIVFYQEVLDRCSCCLDETKDKDEESNHPATLLRHEHVRGAIHTEEHGRRQQRVRKKHHVDEDEGDEF